MKNQSPEVQKGNTNYMQVGDMTACGHCQPDKFQAVMPCECICHNKQLIFETREEAREYFLNKILTTLVDDLYEAWLSEQNVIINNEK